MPVVFFPPGQSRKRNRLFRHFGGVQADWLDLSTGINPWAYPLPELAPTVWRRLPEPDELEALERAATHAYGVPAGAAAVSAPGSSALIACLPRLIERGLVNVLGPTYAEHAEAWRAAGHTVR